MEAKVLCDAPSDLALINMGIVVFDDTLGVLEVLCSRFL